MATDLELSLRQVAELFEVSESTIVRWIQAEKLPVHDSHGVLSFHRVELLEWGTNHGKVSPWFFQSREGMSLGHATVSGALDQGGVAHNVSGADRYEVFRAAVRDLPLPVTIDRDHLLDLLMAREKSGGTAIGHGIAIPHPRYPVVLPGGESIMRACYLDRPLDYYVHDSQPVDTLFLMICPSISEHLHLLARLAYVLQSEDFRNILKLRPDKLLLVTSVRAEEAKAKNDEERQPT